MTTGAKSERDANEALGMLFEEFRVLGIDVPDAPTLRVQNIVSSDDLGSALHLNPTAIALDLERVEYEPEPFPGVVYRLDEPSVLLLLFGSGKLVTTGAKRLADVEHALERIHSRLEGHGLLG